LLQATIDCYHLFFSFFLSFFPFFFCKIFIPGSLTHTHTEKKDDGKNDQGRPLCVCVLGGG
jgi:hypothetical protein